MHPIRPTSSNSSPMYNRSNSLPQSGQQPSSSNSDGTKMSALERRSLALHSTFRSLSMEESSSGRNVAGDLPLHEMNSGIDLFYEDQSALRERGRADTSARSSSSSITGGVIANAAKWRNFTSDITSSADAMRDMRRDFDSIKDTSNLSGQFIKDFRRDKYKVNGKLIPNNDFTALESAIPDLRKRQLVSAYANQTIFADPTNEILSAQNLLKKFVFDTSSSQASSYDIKSINDKETKLTAKYEAKLKAIDPLELSDSDKIYSSAGMKIKIILSENQPPQPEYSYFLKERRSLGNSLGCIRWN